MISLTIEGVAQTVARFLALQAAAQLAALPAAGAGAAAVLARAKALAPEETGRLKGAIQVKEEDGEVLVGLEGVPYAKFQEYGFHHVGSGEFIIHSFLRPAADGAWPQVQSGVEGVIAAAIAAVVGL